MNSFKKIGKLEAEIRELESKIKEKESILPAHSIKPEMIKGIKLYHLNIIYLTRHYKGFIYKYPERHDRSDSIFKPGWVSSLSFES